MNQSSSSTFSMEFTQLKCFIAVAREQSFTRAAKACHLSQPSLSYQISKLEEELGESLFIRKPKGVELSDSGKLLLDGAHRLLEEQEKIVSTFRMREELMAGDIRFGIIPTMAPYLLPPLLGDFRADHPQVRLLARESRTSQLLKEVVEGDLEFAVVSDVAPALLKRYSLHLSKLFDEPLLLAVPNAHPACSLSELTTKSISEDELILLSEGNCLRDQTVRLCQRSDRSSSLECEQLPTQLSMVAAGLGVAIVPEMAVSNHPNNALSFLRFKHPAPKRMIGLLKKRGGKLSPAAAEFLKRLKKQSA
ncbi:LysR substrate-binding domain-containing protein [Pelagicoccus sp. SDUM812005]|uniref:LysR family transcriptional regulator n=1 Tax=Pelagicoccus sp. SDUM812005 TaxID=3041257 RepID=UPI00280CDD02|nr:LysR substrate-binding domain-containing protein [Pelagicoccus sp. SDUM812005]MDQ8182834.1 LysR substrate-binding domain-containing protein [Pelagicoccus sp. SDUM812005]